jgi:hypothetical protein
MLAQYTEEPRFVVVVDDDNEDVSLFCRFCDRDVNCDETPAQIAGHPQQLIERHYYGGADRDTDQLCPNSHKWTDGSYVVRDSAGVTLRRGNFKCHPVAGLRFL